jgi:diguanylate cyclase (GGDEF)-like protein/PAS domain S-box-containing protein
MAAKAGVADEFDVAVVGGGLVGVATAWGLAREGCKVVVLDEGDRAVRAHEGHRNEVGRLARAFNLMLDTLSSKEQELLKTNLELEQRVAQRTAALAETEETHRAILEQANDAFVTTDRQGRVASWNRMAEMTFGWSAAEAIGTPLPELMMPPEMRGMSGSWMQRYLNGGGNGRMVDRRAELTGWRRDGTLFPVEASVRARTRGDGTVFFDAFLRDISERKSLEAQLQALALEDTLTKLPNRRAALQAVPAATARALRAKKLFAVLFLDLDGFKQVNDRLGHPAGDEVLRRFSTRLKDCVRSSDLLARLGGDEFLVILEGLADEADAQCVAHKIIEASCEPYQLGDDTAQLSASVGVRMVGIGDDATPDELLAQADAALYAAKRAGKRQVQVWVSPTAPCRAGSAGGHAHE